MKSHTSPFMVPIIHIRQETPNVRTFRFRAHLESQPGQFVMLWIPGVDQKPFSIGNDGGEWFELTVFALGDSTKKLCTMQKGDCVGITGPFGTSYHIGTKKHVITVGGGYGAAPLVFLTEQARRQQCSVDFCVGARTAEDVLFERRAARVGAKVFVTTDDGSRGIHGFVTQALEERLQAAKKAKKIHKTFVAACGPEPMQVAVATICQRFHVSCELSVERYMKCGFGICGNCCVDDSGITTCQQGPVMSAQQALQLSEFGKYHRDKMGIRHSFA